MNRIQIAILDDYQHVALQSANWSIVADQADITVFHDHLSDSDALAARLLPFDVIVAMRERTPLPRRLLERLPKLRLIASTGPRNASIDVSAATDLGIEIRHTGYRSDPTIEFTWAMILASARHLVQENQSVRQGGWQTTLGMDLKGKTLGILGLGSIGAAVARIGLAFGMTVITWSQNMTAERAENAGAVMVSKEELFAQSDILTIHLVASPRTTGLIGIAELALMKSTALLVNTARGPIVDEQALVSALQHKRIAGAAIDVYDEEPLPSNHPFRKLDNVLATPHIGYGSEGLYRTFYEDSVANIQQWLSHIDRQRAKN